MFRIHPTKLDERKETENMSIELEVKVRIAHLKIGFLAGFAILN